MSLSFAAVPYTFTRSPGLFRNLLAPTGRPATQTTRILVVGDSQEVSNQPYLANLYRQSWQVYGNNPEAHIATVAQDSNDWPVKKYLAGATADQDGTHFGRILKTSLIPGCQPVSITSAATSIMLLDYTGATNSGNDATFTGPYFASSPDLWVWDIFAATNASSGEIGWQGTPTNSKNLAFGTATASGTTSLGLQDAGAFQIKKFTTPTIPWGGQTFLQLQVTGSSATVVDFVGARPRNTTHPGGVVWQPYGGGGQTAKTIMTSWPNDSVMLQALGIDLVMVCTGTNDTIVTGGTAATYKSDLYGTGVWNGTTGSLVETLRSKTGNATLPFLFVSDQYVRATGGAALSGALQTEYDQQPGVHFEIAAADQYCASINGRRVGDALGWNSVGYTTYTSDGIHPNWSGGQIKAGIDMTLIQQLWGGGAAGMGLARAGMGLGIS